MQGHPTRVAENAKPRSAEQRLWSYSCTGLRGAVGGEWKEAEGVSGHASQKALVVG